MSKLTKKLIVSIITLTFAFIALGTTTFAWFTLSNTVTVAQFQAQVTTGSGFEVSVDGGINYYTNVPQSAIQGALAKYDETFKLLDLTSSNGKEFKKIINTSGTFSYSDVTTGFIELELTFRSPVNLTNIYLGDQTRFDITNPEGSVKSGISWKSDVPTFTNAKGTDVVSGTTKTFYAADAARMSFTAGSTTVVYESPATTGDANYFGNTVLNSAAIANGAVSYYNAKTGDSLPHAGATLPSSITAGGDALIITLGGLDVDEKPLAPGADGYYVGVVTFRVWIEGWDPDCFNAILDDYLKVNLHFITN